MTKGTRHIFALALFAGLVVWLVLRARTASAKTGSNALSSDLDRLMRASYQPGTIDKLSIDDLPPPSLDYRGVN